MTTGRFVEPQTASSRLWSVGGCLAVDRLVVRGEAPEVPEPEVHGDVRHRPQVVLGAGEASMGLIQGPGPEELGRRQVELVGDGLA